MYVCTSPCKVTVTLVKAARNGDDKNTATRSTPRQSERDPSAFIRR